MNLLLNHRFEEGEGGRTHDGSSPDEAHVPKYWTAFWLVQKDVPHDPENEIGYVIPEMAVIHKSGQYVNPVVRIHGGDYALKIHAMWKLYEAGYYQQIHVPAGTDISAHYFAHAWSSREDDARHSDLGTDSDFENVTFYVGVDPKGGTDPWAPEVEWSDGDHLYDEYEVVGPYYTTAIANKVTIFMRVATLWGFKHVDAYMDSAEAYVEGWPGSDCWGEPDEDYVRTVLVLPQNATLEDALEATRLGYPNRRTQTYSPSEALMGKFTDKTANFLYPNPQSYDDIGGRNGINQFRNDNYPRAQIEHNPLYEKVDPVDPPPTNGWTPKRYVPTGWLGGMHAIGGDGTEDMFLEMNAQGATMPSVKAVQDIGWMREVWLENKSCLTIGRFINDGEEPSLEGFHYFKEMTEQDVRAQAEARIHTLMPLWGLHREYVKAWEFMNEQKAAHASMCRAKTDFNWYCMDIASQYGYRVAVFSDSTGTPEPYEWDIIADMGFFEAMVHYNAVMSLHEYGIMNDLGSHICRFRYPYDSYILPHHLDVPLVVSEWAPDPWGGIANFSPQELMAQVAAYDHQLMQYPYVAGFHIYTLGGTGSWKAHRDAWNACRGELINYAVSQRDRING